MTSDNLCLRYGHVQGHTEVVFSSDGKSILSSGFDGLIKIWKDLEKDDNPRAIKAAEKVYAIAAKGDTIYAATDNNSVDKINFSDGSPDGLLLRFTSNASHIMLSESQNAIVVGSSDFTAKMVDFSTESETVFTGHKAPILSVAADPLDEYVATISCDGDLRIWNISDSTCIETKRTITPSNDVCNSETLARMSWRPATGEDIAVPSGNAIQLLTRGTWTLVYSFKTALTSKVFNCCTFSPCGRFLAAATTDGWICIWDAETQDCLSTVQHSLKSTICSLIWNPKENNTLALADVRGQIGILKDAVPTKTKANQNSVPDDLDALFEDEDGDINGFLDDAAVDDDKFNDDLPVIKKKTKNIFDDDMDSKDGLSQSSDIVIPSTNNLFIAEDDLAPPLIPPTAKQPNNQDEDDFSSASQDQKKDPGARQLYDGPKPTPMQPAFQPGSTPLYISHRFMTWNSVGTIRSYSDETEIAIDVEFHDRQHHYPLHLRNESTTGEVYNTMADLSMNAIALAAESIDDAPSKLTCIYYASWEGNKEWSAEMPQDEEIKALTIGENWVAACTDARIVRIFSLGGTQRFLFSIPGPVVVMSAHTDQLFIVYHLTQGFNDNQCLGCMLLDIGTGNGANRPKKIIGGEPLPLSKKSLLQWIGFTAEGTPAMVDTNGIVRMMNRGLANTWIPVSDLKKLTKNRHDHYWVVGLHENPQEMRCILCKGSTYPATLPRPFPTIQSYSLPLCEPTSEKTKFEEEYWRGCLFSTHTDFLESHGFETDENYKQSVKVLLQQTLMKMFALACKVDREARAYEICTLMPSSSSVSLAIKYASRLKRMALAQKLTELVQEKSQEEMEALMKKQRSQMQATEDDYEEEENEDFRAEMQAGYSHTKTEWNNHKRKHILNKRNENRRTDDEDDCTPLDSQTEILDSPNDELPDLDRGRDTNQPVIKLSAASRNPFKKNSGSKPTSLAVANKLPSSKSVLDNITRNSSISQKLRGVIAKTHSASKKNDNSPKETKKQQTLFGNNKKFQLTSTPKGKKQKSSLILEKTNESQSAKSENASSGKTEAASGVMLYISEMRQSLGSEKPELDPIEIKKLAIERFRNLSREEKQQWNSKAENCVAAHATTTVASGGGAKRKYDVDSADDEENNSEDCTPSHKQRRLETDVTTSKKQPLNTANSKLLAFAYDGSE